MQTSDHGFEQIMSAVLEQKQVWEQLQTENRELRQEMVDLRAGRGIFVEIDNQRFELAWESSKTNPDAPGTAQNKRTKASKNASQPVSIPATGVLEEMLLDELSSAMNNRMAAEGKPSTSFNEEQNATLRRELSGSFLLE